MNFRIAVDPPAIVITGAAIDNATVFGSLKMARAALDSQVAEQIKLAGIDCEKGIVVLKLGTAEYVRDLRAARKLALHVREADLASEAADPLAGVELGGPL